MNDEHVLCTEIWTCRINAKNLLGTRIRTVAWTMNMYFVHESERTSMNDEHVLYTQKRTSIMNNEHNVVHEYEQDAWIMNM